MAPDGTEEATEEGSTYGADFAMPIRSAASDSMGSASANPPPAPLTRLIPEPIASAWEEIIFTFCTQSSRLPEMRLRKTPTAYKEIARAAINNVATTTVKTIRIISHPFPIGFRKLNHGRASR